MDSTPTRRQQSTPIFVGQKYVGKVENGVFIKSVRGTTHFLRIPAAIALDVQSLADAEAAGADRVHIVDTVTQRHYWALISYIRAHGFPVERGYGRQIALGLQHWQGRGEQLLPADTPVQPPSPIDELHQTQTSPTVPSDSPQLQLVEE